MMSLSRLLKHSPTGGNGGRSARQQHKNGMSFSGILLAILFGAVIAQRLLQKGDRVTTRTPSVPQNAPTEAPKGLPSAGRLRIARIGLSATLVAAVLSAVLPVVTSTVAAAGTLSPTWNNGTLTCGTYNYTTAPAGTTSYSATLTGGGGGAGGGGGTGDSYSGVGGPAATITMSGSISGGTSIYVLIGCGGGAGGTGTSSLAGGGTGGPGYTTGGAGGNAAGTSTGGAGGAGGGSTALCLGTTTCTTLEALASGGGGGGAGSGNSNGCGNGGGGAGGGGGGTSGAAGSANGGGGATGTSGAAGTADSSEANSTTGTTGTGYGGGGGGPGIKNGSPSAGPGGGGGGGTGGGGGNNSGHSGTGGRASSGGGGIAGGNNTSGTGGLSGDTNEVAATPASNTGTTSGTSAGQSGGAGGYINSTSNTEDLGGGGGGAGWSAGGGGGPSYCTSAQQSAGGGGGGSSWSNSGTTPTFGSASTTTVTTCGHVTTSAAGAAISATPGQAGTGTGTGAGIGYSGCTGNVSLTWTGGAPATPTLTAGSLTVNSGVAISASITSSTATSYTESGTLPSGITFSSSTGAFSGSSTAAGSYGFTVTATNSYGTSSAGSFTLVIVGPPSQIAFTPTTLGPGTAGTAVPNIAVSVEDSSGHVVTSQNTGSIAMTIATGPAGGAFTGGSTTTVNVTNGVASFTNLVLDTAGSYTLTATPTGITGVSTAITSTAFTVKPATENKLIISPEPASSITAGGTVSMSVTIEDTYGNTITTGNTGSADSIKVTLSSGSFASGTTTVAASNGVANFSGLQINTAGSYTITASDTTTGTVASATSTSITVNPASANHFVLSATTTTPTAGSGDNLTITATDQYGNTDPTYTGSHNLTFSGGTTIGSFVPSVSDSSGNVDTFGTTTPITFTNGVATVSGSNNGVMTLYKAGAQSITTTDGTLTTPSALVVTVAPATAVSFAITNPGTPTAGTAFNLTVTALDTYGNTATGFTGSKAVSFSGPSTSPNSTAPTYPTSATFTSGVATPSITLTDAQSTTITVTSTVTGTSTSFTVNPGTAASLNLAAATNTPAAGAGDNLTITALDADGNTATGYTGSQSLTFAGASPVGGNNPTVTNASGTAVAFGTATPLTFISGVSTVSGSANGVMKLYKAGATNITASATSPTLASNTLSVVVSPGASATSLSISAATITPTAGVGDNLTITALDQYGNTAPSYTGLQNLTFGGASSIGSFNPTVTDSSGNVDAFGTTTPITFTNGVATVSGSNNGVMVLYKSGAASITVTDGSINNGSGLAVTVSPATAATFTVTNPGTETAGISFSLPITAYDTYGNIATGYTGAKTITFTGPSNSPNNTAPTGSASVTFTSGAGTATVTLYDAQSTTITATQGSITGTSTSFTVNPSTLASFAWSGYSTTSPTAGTPFTATISALDAYGNAPSGGYISANSCVTFSGPSNSPDANAPVYPAQGGCAAGQSSLSFNSSGQATGVTFTLYDAQTTTITATSVTPSGKTGVSTSLTVGANSAASFVVTNPGSQTAGTAFNLSLKALDSYGNTATGFTGSQAISFSGPSNSPNSSTPIYPGTVSFSSGLGTASITLVDAQSTTITATQGSITGTSTSFTVAPAGAFSFVVPTPGTQTAGVAFNETLTALDTYGNTATGYTGSKTIVFTGPSNSPNNTAPTYPGSVSFTSGSGTASITLVDAQTTTLTATQGSVTGTTPLSFTVSPATAVSLLLSAATTNPTAGAGDNLTITAKDTYGNVATGYTGSKNLTFSGAHAQGANNPTVSDASGSAINFGSSTSITFSSGISTVSGSANGVMTLYKTETVSITVTDGTINNGTGLSVTVGFATASQLVFVQGPSAAFTGIAMAPAMTVQVEDPYGNNVADNNLSITLTPSTGSISSGAVASTNSSGLATFSSTIWTQTYLGITLTASPTSSGTGIAATPPSSSFNVTVLASNGAPLTDAATDSGSGVDSVTYYYCSGYATACSASSGTLIGTSSGSSPYTVAWNGQPADGSYDVVAVGTDNVTNTSSASASTPVTIDNSGPSNSITAPVPSTIYNSTNDTWQTAWSGTISGTASANGSVPLQSVKYSVKNNGNNEYWNGTSFSSASQVLLTATGTSSWSASFPVANFATTGGGGGSYTLTAIATDTSGSSSTPVTSTFFIDENPTNTVFVSPTGNNSNSGLTSSAPKLTIAAGVAAAASAGRTVIAVGAASGGSTYNEGALALTSSDNNMSVEGGWSTSTWLRTASYYQCRHDHGQPDRGPDHQCEQRDAPAAGCQWPQHVRRSGHEHLRRARPVEHRRVAPGCDRQCGCGRRWLLPVQRDSTGSTGTAGSTGGAASGSTAGTGGAGGGSYRRLRWQRGKLQRCRRQHRNRRIVAFGRRHRRWRRFGRCQRRLWQRQRGWHRNGWRHRAYRHGRH